MFMNPKRFKSVECVGRLSQRFVEVQHREHLAVRVECLLKTKRFNTRIRLAEHPDAKHVH